MPAQGKARATRSIAAALFATLLAAQPSYAAPLQLNLPNPNLAPRASTFSSHPAGLIYAKQSQLAGMPIKAGIGNIANPATRGQGIVNSMWEGLKSGVVSVGVQAATQALNLDPFAGSLISRTLSGAISGAISPSHNVFQGVYDAFRQSVGNFSTIPPPPDPEDPRFITTLQDGSKIWNRAAYEGAIGQYETSRPVWMAQAMAKTNNFSDEIRQYGLAQAVENYATSIFHRDSVESLVQSFGSIKNAITERMRQNKVRDTTLSDGTQAKELSLLDNKINLLLKEDPFGEISLLGLTEDEIDQRYYELRADRQTRTAGMADGTIIQRQSDGTTVAQKIRQGTVQEVEIKSSGETFKISGPGTQTFLSAGIAAGEVTLQQASTGEEITLQGTLPKRIKSGFIVTPDGQLIQSSEALKPNPERGTIVVQGTDAAGTEWEFYLQAATDALPGIGHDLWNVASLGTLYKVEKMMQEHPDAGQVELLGRSLWAGTTSIANAFSFGYLDVWSEKIGQLAPGSGFKGVMGAFIEGTKEHTRDLSSIDDWARVRDPSLPTLDRVQSFFTGTAKVANLLAAGLALRGLSVKTIEPTIISPPTQTGILARGLVEASEQGTLFAKGNAWAFESTAGKMVGSTAKYVEETTLVRVVKRNWDPVRQEYVRGDPLQFGNLEGRYNSAGTERLYGVELRNPGDPTAFQTVIREGTKWLESGDIYDVYTYKVRPGTLAEVSINPEAETLSRVFGDTILKRADSWDGVRFPSAQDASGTISNVMIKDPSRIIGEAEWAGEGVKQ